MIFPTLKNKAYGYINLNEAAKSWAARQSGRYAGRADNPLNDPAICAQMVEDFHGEHGWGFSFGGWLEDRSFVWRGSYLEKAGTFTHLGIDYNAPAGTEVAVDFDAEVLFVDSDYPEIGGWGSRVIMKHKTEDVYFIYAHLDYTYLDRATEALAGMDLEKGEIFAKIGSAPYNGNWYPHVHVQVLSRAAFEAAADNHFESLDGYGHGVNLPGLAMEFPDPKRFIKLS
jgi:murein DD-endopeptidase MepM/ murein hydrolase activator NlpD